MKFLTKPQTRDRIPERLTDARFASLSTAELLRRFAHLSAELVKKEVALANAELRANVKQEAAAAKGLGVAGLLALAAMTLLLIFAVDVVARVTGQPPWIVALVGAGIVAIAAAIVGAIGWKKRVKTPLERTRRTLEDDVRWAKHGLT